MSEPESPESQLRKFRLAEFESLRQELAAINAQCFKIELTTVGGALAVAAFMIQYHNGPSILWSMPAVLLAIGGASLWSKGKHMNRISDYLTHNIEVFLGGPLLNAVGDPLRPRVRNNLLDRLAGKGESPTINLVLDGKSVKQVVGGWEAWFEQQPYNYTWFQIWVWVICFGFAVVLGVVGALHGVDKLP